MMLLILSYLIFAAMSACFTVILHWSIGSPRTESGEIQVRQGRIFSRYGNYLKENHKGRSIFKPLGLCFICFSVWVNIISVLIFTVANISLLAAFIGFYAVFFAVVLSIFIINQLT